MERYKNFSQWLKIIKNWGSFSKLSKVFEQENIDEENNKKNDSYVKKEDKMVKNLKKYELNDNIFKLLYFVLNYNDKYYQEDTQYKLCDTIAEIASSDYRGDIDGFLSGIEPVLKKILRMVKPDEYEEYVGQTENEFKECSDNEKAAKGLTALITKLIRVTREEQGVVSYKGKEGNYILKRIPDIRNQWSGHDSTRNVDDSLKIEIGEKGLIVLLWAIMIWDDELNEIHKNFRKESNENAIHRICEFWKESYDEKIKYISLEYKKTSNPDDDSKNIIDDVNLGNADDIVNSMDFDTQRVVKLVAKAGMGKTTLLERLNYYYSSLIDEKKIFPLFIRCNEFNGDVCTVHVKPVYDFGSLVYFKINKICEKLHLEGIDASFLVDYIYDNYSVLHLIDGLNEINNYDNKNQFVDSLDEYIKSKTNSYFLLTERYAKEARTIKDNVQYYTIPDLSDEIQIKFFEAYDKMELYRRIEFQTLVNIKNDIDEEEKLDIEFKNKMDDLKECLSSPFYITLYCEFMDNKAEKEQLVVDKYDLISRFVKHLINRESDQQGEPAKYSYLLYYLRCLGSLIKDDKNFGVNMEIVTETFGTIMRNHGLDVSIYNSDHILKLFEELGFISRTDEIVYVNELYAICFKRMYTDTLDVCDLV